VVKEAAVTTHDEAERAFWGRVQPRPSELGLSAGNGKTSSALYTATPSSVTVGDLNRPPGLQLVRIADVEREEVSWRWSGRLPRGKLVLIEGDPGTGKSWLTMAISTAVTLGNPLPGDAERFESQDVLIFSAEDGLADTIRPRLEDMGADLTRVQAVSAVMDANGAERFPSLADDLLYIDAALAAGGYGIVVIDPLNAYLKGVDGNRDIDLRAVLGPVGALAERYGVTIICVRHLTKGSRDRAIYRGQGNIAYTAAARVVLLVGVNPDDGTEHVIVPIKNNLAPLATAMSFELVDGRFLWKGETRLTAEQLLAPDSQGEERTARDAAVEFLSDALADGARPTVEVYREANAMGIAKRTLERAKASLGIVARPRYQEGKRGAQRWHWSLPLAGSSTAPALDRQVQIHGQGGDLNASESERETFDGQAGDLKVVVEEEVI
jgi:hypothetical protein